MMWSFAWSTPLRTGVKLDDFAPDISAYTLNTHTNIQLCKDEEKVQEYK